MVRGYNAQEADRYFCEPPEPTKCEFNGRDNCYQCPDMECEFWEDANV